MNYENSTSQGQRGEREKGRGGGGGLGGGGERERELEKEGVRCLAPTQEGKVSVFFSLYNTMNDVSWWLLLLNGEMQM